MKKLDLLLLAKDRDKVLRALQELGVVHIEEKSDLSSSELEDASRKLKNIESVLQSVRKTIKEKKGKKIPADIPADIAKTVREWQDLEKKIQSADARLAGLTKDEAVLSSWGDFDPEVLERLSSAGVTLRFFEVPVKDWDGFLGKNPSLVEISRGSGKVRAVLFEKGVRAEIVAEEVRPPRVSLSAIRTEIEQVRKILSDLDKEREKYLGCAPALAGEKKALADEMRFETARLSCGEEAEGNILYLTGWFPAKSVKALETRLATEKIWFGISEPAAEDNPPVHVENNWFAKKFEFLLKMYALPGYRELDPTPLFAPFFVLFVGLCMGDVAYGSVILLVSILLAILLPKPIKWFGALGAILGVSVILSGAILNSFFGLTLFGGDGVPGPTVLPFGGKYAFFTAVNGKYPMMSFALLIGFVQLLLAFILRIINKIRTSGLKAAAVPLSYVLILIGFLSWAANVNFLKLGWANFSVSGVPFGKLLLYIPATAGLIMMAVAVPLNVVFSNADKKGGERWTMVFIDFYNGVTGLLSSILSYIRLFALGLTGGLLGAAFNQLALMPITRDGAIHWLSPGVIATVLILVMGHSLNFLLAIIGSFVHPLRLTYVEFLQNMDFAWSGRPYKPLAKS
jgi:V/A-type H+-transporting ATPase subunit I